MNVIENTIASKKFRPLSIISRNTIGIFNAGVEIFT